MSLQLEISDAAKEDIALQMAWYEVKADKHLALRYEQALRASFQILLINPNAGRPRHFRPRTLEGIKSLSATTPFDKHLIFYRTESGVLKITRVLHGMRDLPRRLLETPSSE